MKAARTALQLARIPALLALLWATAEPVKSQAQAISILSQEDYRPAWALIAFLSLAFVVLMLAGRRRRHPFVLLAVEGAAAAVVAFTSPMDWVNWLGVGGSWVTAMGGGHAQALAMAWLGVVGLRAFHQLRDGSEAVSRPDQDATPIAQVGR